MYVYLCFVSCVDNITECLLSRWMLRKVLNQDDRKNIFKLYFLVNFLFHRKFEFEAICS